MATRLSPKHAGEIRLQTCIEEPERERCEIGALQMQAFIARKPPAGAAATFLDDGFLLVMPDVPDFRGQHIVARSARSQ